MLLRVFREVGQAKHRNWSYLRVWLIPESHFALKAIQKHEGISATDAVNRAIQTYARLNVP